MKKINYKINLFLLTTSFILVISNSCFAKSANKGEDPFTTFFIILVHIIIFVFWAAIFYAFYLKPFIKKKKIENYCVRNKLEYIEESKSLPNNNIGINFIKVNSSNNGVGEYKFKNIIHGVKNGLYFILCDFYLSFGHYDGIYIFSPGFPLLIIKKTNMNLPYFFLRTGNDLSRFKEIGTMTGESRKLRKLGDAMKPVYRKHISFYFGKRLEFNEDEEFNNKFVLEVNDLEATKTLFNSNSRSIFKNKAKKDYVFEGNGDSFIVTSSKESSFEEMIMFLEENLKLFKEISDSSE